jgi:ligand-binding SRPBCC domain-containing protein
MGGASRTIERSTRLAAPADEVWTWVTTPEGINDEFRPWMRMTVPRAFRGRTLADVEAPVTIGRSWVLLFGVLPFDCDHLHLAEVDAGERRFAERSTMLSASSWSHDRRVEPDGSADACVLHDRVGFVLRRPMRWLPWSDRLYGGIVGAIFRHRHRRLARRFGP